MRKYPLKLPQAKKEAQEFGPGKTDYLICPQCHCVYFDKSWHHSLEQDIKKLREEKQVKFQLCPACQMIKDERFEGEIIVENVPERFKEDIKRLAKNFGKRAFEEDPLDRVISIEDEKDVRILTTENQLAVRLAKKIDEVFDGKSKVLISHSKKEDTIRVKISF